MVPVLRQSPSMLNLRESNSGFMEAMQLLEVCVIDVIHRFCRSTLLL